MAACRPLTPGEFTRVRAAFTGPCALRNRAMFELGCGCGFRVSELLAMDRTHVLTPAGAVVAVVAVERRHMKGKHEARAVAVPTFVQQTLAEWLVHLGNAWGGIELACPLFPTRSLRRLSRVQAYWIIRRALDRAAIPANGAGRGTHTWRKTFAAGIERVLLDAGDPKNVMLGLQRALGHRQITSTQHYVRFDRQDVDRAVAGAAERLYGSEK